MTCSRTAPSAPSGYTHWAHRRRSLRAFFMENCMTTEPKHLMNAAFTKPIEEFFLQVVTTMKLQDCN